MKKPNLDENLIKYGCKKSNVDTKWNMGWKDHMWMKDKIWMSKREKGGREIRGQWKNPKFGWKTSNGDEEIQMWMKQKKKMKKEEEE